mgnify:CR=1 FL=1
MRAFTQDGTPLPGYGFFPYGSGYTGGVEIAGDEATRRLAPAALPEDEASTRVDAPGAPERLFALLMQAAGRAGRRLPARG